MAVAGSAFIRFRQELLQQPQIAGIVKLHQFCPVFQLCGGDSRELLHIYGVLGFVLQERNQKPLAFKVIRLLNAVDRAVGGSPAARTEPAEGQIIHPAAEHEALENVDGIFRRPVRQLNLIDGGNRFPPDVGAVIALCFPEKRMIALRLKHRLKPLRQKCFLRVGHTQKRFQPRQQLLCGLRLRQAAVKGIPVIDLIQAEYLVELVRYVKPAVFAIFKDRHVCRKNVLEFLMFPHVRDSAFDITIHEKLTDLHIRSPLQRLPPFYHITAGCASAARFLVLHLPGNVV